MPIFKQLKQNKLLLDTHVWIWLFSGDECLSKHFVQAVDVAQQNDLLLVSAISVWEIGMLAERKRINFELDPLDWVESCLKRPGMNLIPLTPAIAIQSSRLPEEPHGDPADRILIATANDQHAVLVTHDKKLINYGKGKFINVYDPC